MKLKENWASELDWLWAMFIVCAFIILCAAFPIFGIVCFILTCIGIFVGAILESIMD